MSKTKDRERATQVIYRSGQLVARSAWDKHQRELRELAEEQKLKALGLTRNRPRIFTLDDVWNARQSIRKG